MPTIKKIEAIEILDSRGRPTIKTTVTLASGVVASASVPSGASTGSSEAHELRDGDPRRYRGMGCLQAVANVNNEIHQYFTGRSVDSQLELDSQLIKLDGTENKQRLGANAILSASIAFARCHALERNLALYNHFAQMAGTRAEHMPQLTVNLFSGGAHAGGQVAIQDCLLVPYASNTTDQSLSMVYSIYQVGGRSDTCGVQHQGSFRG